MLFVHPGTACKWSDHVTSSLLYYLAILIDTQSTSHCVILIWWYAMCQRIASFILHEESGIDSQCRALYVSPSGDISPLFSRISSSPRWSSVAGLVRASILSSTFIAQYFNSVFKNISIFQRFFQEYFNISTVCAVFNLAKSRTTRKTIFKWYIKGILSFGYVSTSVYYGSIPLY